MNKSRDTHEAEATGAGPGAGMSDTDSWVSITARTELSVPSTGQDVLSQVPARQRRLLAVLLSPLAVVLLVAGVLAVVLSGSPAGHLVGAVLAIFALLLLGIAQGLFRSAALTDRALAEERLDAAILSADGGSCGGSCDSCGVDDCAVKSLPRS